jgi:hypothetical protein
VLGALGRNTGQAAAEGFRLPDAVEPRLGLELMTPLSCGCGNLRLRAGVSGRSPGMIEYEGADPDLSRAFAGGSWRAVLSAGGSFVGEYFGRAVRLDLDSTDLLRGPRISVGLSARF